MEISGSKVRQDFIDFFKSKNHIFVPSSPVVPADDPTLLFTNAGMNQFKSIFLGDNKQGYKRVANSQKCMRVSGKHNDLEEVGRDHYHHTFFEMLGNWSFGDYYKKEAIAWAWELLTCVWRLPKERLFVTVFETDDEAEEYWKTQTDIEHWRILRFGEKTNFWEMGDTGPCGPCSEIHYDIGDVKDQRQIYKDPQKGVNGTNDRFREIWNLVFIQYNREKDGSLKELPNKHVDTGMGLERIVSVLQKKNSNYDTDLFLPIIKNLEEKTKKKYTQDEKGTPFRVIADHIRALVVSITDGVIPSNEGRGYVVRRLLRRAARFGKELGFKQPFLYTLVPEVCKILGDAFLEIKQRSNYVSDVIKTEEERFNTTLEQGIEKFSQIISNMNSVGTKVISGKDVFILYDTYGFPVDLTSLMAQEKGFSIDEKGFNLEMEKQRKRARDAIKKSEENGLSPEDWVILKQDISTNFVGYEYDSSECNVCRYKIIEKDKDLIKKCLLILDKTPFYAESGGQIGDSGVITTSGGARLLVLDTIKWNDMTIHITESDTPFFEEDLKKPLFATIDSVKRNHIRRNHSATHLLQAALRKVLGEHVHQSGSRVSQDSLRFDFTHHKILSNQEIKRVEELVNEWILSNLPVFTQIKSLEEAKKEGAIALFGEKYGETVRIVSMGNVSKELCGGTHVSYTGTIGLFHIISESSIAAGIRRIEAITGINSLNYLISKENMLKEISSNLKVSQDDLKERIDYMNSRIKELEKQVLEFSKSKIIDFADEIIKEAQNDNHRCKWIVKNIGKKDKESFTAICNAISDNIKSRNLLNTVIAIGAEVESKPLFFAAAGESAAKEYKIHCGEIVKEAAKITGGGGGGSPTRAQSGGKDINKLEEALSYIAKTIKEKIKS
jgi:alanyl-tRNA synthetase